MSLPPVGEIKYTKQKHGYFGELGSGAHARIRFLQSAVTKDELDNITLIENIPGSERWEIRDLFQRDVDMARVEGSILPYLLDPTMVKFFNPLTLVLLPIDVVTGAVDADIAFVPPASITKGQNNEYPYTRYERDGLFCFDVHNEIPAYSDLRWNDTKVKLVAIDGQHRLSALKFWKDAQGPKDLDAWQIPVVILGVFRADNDPSHRPANLLEIVRKTFVFINSRAEEVNEARLILLDDEAIQSVCTQEVMQASHTNDCLPDDTRDGSKLPLLFFDWRGQVRWRKDQGEAIPVAAPGSVLSIEEVHSWLDEYVLGDTPSVILQLEDLDPPLSDSYNDRGILTHEDTARVRKRFLNVVYPGLSYLLEQFTPFKNYVSQIRAFEKSERQKSEAAGYVFQKLRFGSHPVLLGQMKQLVDSTYESIVGQLKNIREGCFDELIEREIGMRAVIHSFSEIKNARDLTLKRTTDWKEHASWYTPKLNAVYAQGWFKKYSDLKKEQSKLLTHICFDPSGDIVNYKLGDVAKALGPLLSLLVVKESLGEFNDTQKAELWGTFSEPLEATLRKGFRKEHKARLKDSFNGTLAAFNAKVNEKADASVTERMKLIEKKVLAV